MQKLSKNNLIVAGIVVAVFIIGGWLLMPREAAAPGDGESNGIVQENSTPIDVASVISTTLDGESVSVSSQPAGTTITVSSVMFTQSGWIAIRDDRGWILGAGRFDEGTHSNVTIKLLRATTPGERYQVLLYVDDGDKQFDMDTEILVTRSDGSVAGTTFVAQ